MKFNKQKIENITNKIKNIKEKITSNKKEQVPKKYYALLILMLLIGMITLSNNMKHYTQSREEDYIEYELEENQEVDASKIEIINYKTAESSISTNVSNMEEAVETMSANNEISYMMPVVGEVTKEYAVEKLVYSETLGMWKTHPGIDIKGVVEAEVKSASDGTVQVVEQDGFYGNVIKILDGEGYIFVYSNLDNNIDLKQGDKVKKGEIIGRIGVSASGELADEAHLHLEVIKDGKQINPLDLIN